MNEIIYKNYSVTDVLLDKPCLLGDIKIHPIKVCEWSEFQRYTVYLLFSKKHLKIDDNMPLIGGIIANVVKYYNNGEMPEKEESIELFSLALKEMCEMIKIITQANNVIFNYVENTFEFILDNTFRLNEDNFDLFRRIVLRQNLLFEPTIYKSKLKEKWAEKVKKGRAKKNKGISFFEMLNIVRSELQITYEEICNLNIFQLYTDFRRINNTKEFETLTILKTKYGVDCDKLPNIDFTDKVLDKILKNSESDLFKEIDANEIM